MIDTIVLRIHGYEKYEHLVKYLEQINTNTYVKKFAHKELEGFNRTSLFYADTDRILPLVHRTSINVPSSNYQITTSCNKERDFIEINLSVPKYLYSTNVMQFIDPHNTSERHMYDKLINFVFRFFSDYFPLSPDMLDVEVNRIDLCYNQFFLSKSDALRYLDEQRKLNLDYARSDKNKFQSYGSTTVQYVTDNYSFKIYHKGTEFRSNDYLKLIKKNPKCFDLGELCEIADKILRYEMTCRNGLMNYLFKQRLKDDPNTMFNHNLSVIQKLRNKASNKMAANFKRPTVTLNSKDPADIFINKTLPNKAFRYTFESLWDIPLGTPGHMPIHLLSNYDLPFSHELFEHLHSFFWERVTRYQLGVKMGMQEILKKIKDHQDEKDYKNKLFAKSEKIAQTGQLLLIATLSQYTDITDLKEVLPKATYYRYRKKLEDLGIPRHSPDIAVAPPALDYSSYFYYFGEKHVTYG